MEFQKMDFKKELAKVCPKLRNGADIYAWGAGNGFKNLREQFRIVHNIELEDFVFGFVDNDDKKHGVEFYGKKVLSPDELDRDNAVVLISVINDKSRSVEKQLLGMGFNFRHDFFDRAYVIWLLRRHMRYQLSRFKDKHAGERCFIIGAGPSLRARDLDLLKDEVTFATNRIYCMFDKTSWRPSYYAIEDDLLLKEEHRTICDAIGGVKFIWSYSAFLCEGFRAENAYFYDIDLRAAYRQYPYEVDFGSGPDVFYWASTVTYTCLQLAALMGFKEIYLLGVDNDFPIVRKADGEIIYRDIKAHFHPEKTNFYYTPNIDLLIAGYEAAQKHAYAHGYKIYNATRGGALDVFERADFDSLFPHKEVLL